MGGAAADDGHLVPFQRIGRRHDGAPVLNRASPRLI
jgi:hypothetical protein